MSKGRFLKFVFIILYFVFFRSHTFAQTPLYKNYSIKDGLPSSETYRVHQDSRGYIWVIGDMGISRFDGYKFQNYTTKDGLPENTILGLYEDYKKRIWFWSLSGELVYFENEKMHPLKEVNQQIRTQFKGGLINSISLDKNDTIHLATCNIRGLFKVYFDSKKQQLIIDKISEEGTYIKIINTVNREVIVSNNLNNFRKESLLNLILDSKTGRKYKLKTDISQFFRNSPYQKSIQLSNGKILISFDHQLWEIDQQHQISKIHEVETRIIYLKEDEKGNVWIGTLNSGVLKIINGDFSTKPIYYLKGNSVTSVITDRENGLWFSSLENGVYYLPNQLFLHYNGLNGLQDENVKCIDIDSKGTIWIGSPKGIYSSLYLNKIKNHNIHFFSKEPFISSIICNNNGSIYIGGRGFFQFKKDKVQKLITNKDELFSSNTMISTKYNGKLWLGGYKRLLEISEGKVIVHSIDYRINTICEGEKGEIWIGELNGLRRFKDNKFTYLGNQHSLLKTRINDIKYLNKTIWMATKGEGLILKKGGEIFQIKENKGLVSDFCKSVFIDSKGIVWVGTNKGLSKITFTKRGDFTHYQIYNYTTVNGLISNEINQVIVKKDKVYVGTNNGLSIFDKNQVKANQVVPPIYISKILVNDSLFRLKNRYSLTYDQNTLKINYIGLSFKNDGNTEYKYRLLGLDTNWHFTTYTTIDYTTLPYGNYSFEVIAKNNDGFWSTKPAIVTFSIAPPFWNTWWFRILAGLTLVSSTLGFIRYRVRMIENREHEKTKLYKKAAEDKQEKLDLFQKASEMELKFLSAQMNPHFTFNAMNSIQHFMLDHEPEKAQQYLAKYSKLIRRVLENNMEKFVPLDDELDMLEIYMEIESMRFATPFEFEINVAEELEEREYQIPPMIIQPYLENAIWHGVFHKKDSAGKIALSFSLEGERIKCIIEDNGVGRKKAKEFNSNKKERRSVGMLITHERLQHLQSDSNLEVESKVFDVLGDNGMVCGTRVEVYLPVENEKCS